MGSIRRFVVAALAVAAVATAGCQGNIGGGTGLSVPQAPGYQQPSGPGGGQTQSRERVLEGAVYLAPKLKEIPLPELAGFGVTLALGSPAPAAATPSPVASASAAASLRTKTRAVARALGSDATTAPSAEASAAASPSAAAPAGSAAPSAVATASASPAPKNAKSPAPASSAYPRIDTKTTVYPDDAPPPPTPMPTGEVQTFVKRTAIVRGYVQLGTDVSLYGLGAVRFTLPESELTPKRGFTIAVFQTEKHRHNKMLAYDTDPTVSGGQVYSMMTDPFVLKKNDGYLLMIYGDETLAPPSAVTSPPTGYPKAGNNPFPIASGNPQPGYTQIPGYPPGSTPYPYPGYSPTPFGFGTPRP